ncbi:MAG: hypothetical protein ACLFP4_12630 [Spirochaetales bacterium]
MSRMSRLFYLYRGTAPEDDPGLERVGGREYQLSRDDFQTAERELVRRGYKEAPGWNDFEIELFKSVSGCAIEVGMFEGTVCFAIHDDPTNAAAVATAQADALAVAHNAGFACYDNNDERWLETTE